MYPIRDEVEFLHPGQHLQQSPQAAGPQQHNNYDTKWDSELINLCYY